MKIKSGDKTSINNNINKDTIFCTGMHGGTYHDTYINGMMRQEQGKVMQDADQGLGMHQLLHR